jgi:hypothetical protein
LAETLAEAVPAQLRAQITNSARQGRLAKVGLRKVTQRGGMAIWLPCGEPSLGASGEVGGEELADGTEFSQRQYGRDSEAK